MSSEVAPITAVALPQDTQLSAAAIEALAAGVPQSTLTAYKADLKGFATWCADTGRSGLPATAETLAEYATYMAYEKGSAPSSIERARWAVRKAHRIAGLPVPDSEQLAHVLKGYRRHLAQTKDAKARPRKATAADQQALSAMLAGLDLGSPAGQRDAALILLGFAIGGRRSELAALDISDVTDTAEGIVMSVYRIKTGKLHEVAVPYAQDPTLCPVIAVTRWLNCLSVHGRTDGALFVRINRHGHLGPRVNRDGQPIGDISGRMTPQAVGQVIGRKARAAALGGKYTGHSLRRGMATAARKAGHDQIRIARQGGWDDNSAVLSGYMEDADRWNDNALKGVL